MIEDIVRGILAELPEGVQLVAAAKTRTAEEIRAAIAGGLRIIGENYYKELEDVYAKIDEPGIEWHFIGHLQRNKVKYVAPLCDMIQTLDSHRLADEINKRCQGLGKVMPVLVEINSGKEAQKSGVLPERAVDFIKGISTLENIRVQGLMTMGPFTGNPENSRPYFRTTKKLFDEIKGLKLPNVEMKNLSMGMTNSYKIAVEEGSNMVRIGTRIFGERIH
ncbi:YggS family pyridoxal phosphate-dependent enzyme [bacterium]|nr:YggS family pyridoxal phosphate-dependent enzyme [bacterium]